MANRARFIAVAGFGLQLGVLGVLTVGTATGDLAGEPPAARQAALTDAATTVEAVLVPVDSGATAGEIRTVDQGASISVDEARVVFDGGREELTVGIPVNDQGDLQALNEQVRATLDDMTADVTAHPTLDGVFEKTLSVATQDAADGVDYTELTVTMAADADPPAGYEVVETPEPPSSDISLTAAASCGATWWPDYVIGHSGASSVDDMRYGTVRFAWTTNSRLTNLKCRNDGNVTFEPDFKTNNYDGKHYFTKTIQAWSSNMSNDYKDTQFDDGNDEWVFTIGTSRANKLDPDHEYRTYFRTNKGNTSADDGAIYPQYGHRTPSFCDSTWCIFGDATKKYIQAWDLPIPGLLAESK